MQSFTIVLILGLMMLGQTFKAQSRPISVEEAVQMAMNNNLTLQSKI
jgi:cobalt-zinc-cadmium resistance protein CzcA